jgi:hypothetical protein
MRGPMKPGQIIGPLGGRASRPDIHPIRNRRPLGPEETPEEAEAPLRRLPGTYRIMPSDEDFRQLTSPRARPSYSVIQGT